jgi:nucleoside-diphosphate-sugar epimerase
VIVQRVLVTGGTGFIGRHLVAALRARGDAVTVVGRRDPAAAARVLGADVPYVHGDLADAGVVTRIFADCAPQRVYHLASAVDVRRDLGLIEEQVRSTQMAAIHVAGACLAAGVERLVHAGSSEEYGDGPAPFRESQSPSPVSPYSAAKVAATAFVHMLATSFQLPAVIVRPFLTYGPGQSANLMIPALIRSALAGRDFPMTGGEQTREFNYIDDIVRGFIQAGDTPGIDGELFNLGCGEPHRIRDVATLVLRLMGDPVRAIFGALPYRPGETGQFYCVNDKARELLGYRPAVPLEEGLRRTIAAFRGNDFARIGDEDA